MIEFETNKLSLIKFNDLRLIDNEFRVLLINVPETLELYQSFQDVVFIGKLLTGFDLDLETMYKISFPIKTFKNELNKFKIISKELIITFRSVPNLRITHIVNIQEE